MSWSWGSCVSSAWFLFSLFSVVSLIKLTCKWGHLKQLHPKQQLVHFKGLAVVSPQRQIIPHLLVSDGTRPTYNPYPHSCSRGHLPSGFSLWPDSPSRPGWLVDSCICCFSIFNGLQASAKTFTNQ